MLAFTHVSLQRESENTLNKIQKTLIVVKIVQQMSVQTKADCTDYTCLYECRVKQMFRINIAVRLTTLLIPTQQLSSLAVTVA